MRKETETVCKAFINREAKSAARTSTDGESLHLFGHRIAWWDNGDLHMTMCGWPTVTTRERLNGLLTLLGIRAGFHQSKRVQHFNDEPIGDDDIITLTAKDIAVKRVKAMLA